MLYSGRWLRRVEHRSGIVYHSSDQPPHMATRSRVRSDHFAGRTAGRGRKYVFSAGSAVGAAGCGVGAVIALPGSDRAPGTGSAQRRDRARAEYRDSGGIGGDPVDNGVIVFCLEYVVYFH